LTDTRNQTKAYGYGLDNKLTTITYTNAVVATPNVTFSYMNPDNPTVPDPYGRTRLMTDGTGTTRYDYKPAGTLGASSLSSVDGPFTNDTVSYTYDELGRVTTHGLSTFSTTWVYDAVGRLATLTSPMGNFLWTYVNTTGRPQTVTYPNGQTTTYSYFGNLGDQRLQEIEHQQTAAGTVLSQFDYTYDAVGNIKTWTQQRETSPAKVYGVRYDPADQLFTASVTGPNPLRYRIASSMPMTVPGTAARSSWTMR
jgi:YD repeat-containing protein